MSYNPNIPQPTDLISESQPQILTNFGLLNTYFDVNHVNYTDATTADIGKHRQGTFINNTSPTATAATELNVYNRLIPNTGGTSADTYQLHFQQVNNGSVGIMTPFAYFVATSPGAIGAYTIQKSFNVSGITLDSTLGLGRSTLTFSNAANDANYIVLLFPLTSGMVITGVVTQNDNNFEFNHSDGSGAVNKKICGWVVALP